MRCRQKSPHDKLVLEPFERRAKEEIEDCEDTQWTQGGRLAHHLQPRAQVVEVVRKITSSRPMEENLNWRLVDLKF